MHTHITDTHTHVDIHMKSSLSTDLNLIFKMTDKWVDFIHTLVKLCWKHIRKKSAGRVVHTWAKKSTHLCPQIERGVDVTNILNGSSVPWNANQRMYFPYTHIYLCILYILLYIQILYEYIVIYSYINIYIKHLNLWTNAVVSDSILSYTFMRMVK